MKIELQTGVAPWQGTNSSALVDTYHFYDIPLIGVMEQGGNQYLFRCMAGELEQTNFWCYSSITLEEIAAIEATNSREEFDAVLAKFNQRPVALAFATDSLGIIAWIDGDDWDDPGEAVKHLMAKVHEVTSNLQQTAAAQSEQILAGIG